MRRNNDFSFSGILFQQIAQIIGDRNNVIVIKRRQSGSDLRRPHRRAQGKKAHHLHRL